MNAPMRRVGIAVTCLMLALVAQLTYLQVVKAQDLCQDPRNVRRVINDFARPRGPIVTADGVVVADSKPVKDEFKYQREYPTGSLFSQIVGYQSFVYGNTGVEASYNDALAGRTQAQCVHNLEGLTDSLVHQGGTNQVVLTLTNQAQTAARDALGNQKGSVVVIQPSTGAILASYSNPSYDPSALAGHDSLKVQAAYSQLINDPTKPYIPRSYAEIYPPGSTFKVVTSSVALNNGVVTPNSEYPVVRSIPLPLSTKSLQNFGGGACGGTVTQSFINSCNTTFARIGLQLGDSFVPGMHGFGVGETPPFDEARPNAAASTAPAAGSFKTAAPQFALAGIGQGPVAVTPLQMALVASAIANNGVIMQPHVGDSVLDPKGNVAKVIKPKPWKTATSPATAAEVTKLMEQVVSRGTGTAARIPGVTVAGKTGTAQVQGSGAPHAWFVAFAPAEQPQFAVAVIIEHGGNAGSEATGGHVAAPVARKVLANLLGKQ